MSADGNGGEARAILRETLAALDMPPAGLRRWLERSKRFCERHGGERRYREWMLLYDEALQVMETLDAR